MATTYKKSLKTLTITTIGGSTITAADTADSPVGSAALSQFENFQTMVIPGESSTTYVPFHAVDHIVVAISESSDIEKPDAYGCEEEGNGEG